MLTFIITAALVFGIVALPTALLVTMHRVNVREQRRIDDARKLESLIAYHDSLGIPAL